MTNGTLKVLGVAAASFLFVSTARATEDKKAAPTDGADAAPPAKVESLPPAPPPPPPPPPAANVSLSPEGSPLVQPGFNWKTTFYGFAEFDVFHDTTQSFIDASSNLSVQRPNTIPGDNGQTQFTARNSRIGMKLEAVPYEGMLATAQAEMDFYGNQAPTASEGAIYTNAPVRMRHYFLKLQNPVVDVLAGQYHDLFAWGGLGFYPNTVAFLAVYGEVYHRNPQLRFSKTLRSKAVDFEVALAAVRPVGREGEIPDGEAGLRVAFNGWRGVRAQGSGPPDTGPLQIGISGVGRAFRVKPLLVPIGDYKKTTGYGAAVNLVIPVIPCTASNMSWGTTITLEATIGKGIADLYPGLSGGARYPAPPNPMMLLIPPVYIPNLDPGLVTFDSEGNIHAIQWQAIVAGLQFHPPVFNGRRFWLTGVGSVMQSTNLKDLTPDSLKATIWTKGYYWDANLFVAITPAVQADLSFQVTTQTYADVVAATNKNVVATNQRAEFAIHYFF